MLTLLIAVWSLDSYTEKNLVFVMIDAPSDRTYDFVKKKLPSRICLDVPYKVFPQSFLIALTVSSPYTGSFAKPDKKNVCKSKNDFWGF